MSDPKRAAIEAQIAALMGELSAEDAAPAPAAPTVTTVAAAPAAGMPVSPLAPAPAPAPATAPTATANRHRVNASPAPSPMFAKVARKAGAKISSPGMLARARPTAPSAAPAAAPVAGEPIAGEATPAAAPIRSTPIVRPTAAPRQLPRVTRAPTLAGLPRPPPARAPVSSSYMRAKPKVK